MLATTLRVMACSLESSWYMPIRFARAGDSRQRRMWSIGRYTNSFLTNDKRHGRIADTRIYRLEATSRDTEWRVVVNSHFAGYPTMLAGHKAILDGGNPAGENDIQPDHPARLRGGPC